MKFSENEKIVIKKLVEFSDEYYFFVNEFFKVVLSDDTALVCYPQKGETFFSYRIETYNNNYDEVKKAYFDVVNIVNLFHKLEKESYVSTIQRDNEMFSEIIFLAVHSKNRLIQGSPVNTESDKPFQFHIRLGENETVVVSNDKWYYECNRIEGIKEYKEEIYDSYIVSEQYNVYGLLNSYVHINQELKELVENDFKAYEEIQLEEAKKQTKYSFLAVVLSVIAIVVSLIVPQCASTTLDQQQFDTIQIMQNELIHTLDELKIIQIDNDSLKKELDLMQESIDEISNITSKKE